MNRKPVEYSFVDSSSNQLKDTSNPKFFLKVTVFEQLGNSVKLIVFFEAIGLFGEYWLTKGNQEKWQIDKFNFSHS